MNQFRFSVAAVANRLGALWRQQLLATAEANFDPVVYLCNYGVAYPDQPFPNRLYAGANRVVPFPGPSALGNDLDALASFHAEHPCHLVGYLGYDLKNQLEPLTSRHPDRLGFNDIWFFEPTYILDFEADTILLQTNQPTPGPWAGWLAGVGLVAAPPRPANVPAVVQARVSRDEYLATAEKIRALVEAGDVYELNYCMEFFAESLQLDPLPAYEALCGHSPMPFSVFLKQNNRYVLGTSPERFLRKMGTRLCSQPIKGTARRGYSPAEDEQLKTALRNSRKEQAENLMIVDLVRNDLARSAQTGTVQVEELFGLYTFRQVHQLISTVTAQVRPGVSLAQVLGHAFPMGSMTGAPKVRAMQRIDELEASRRGLYSGAIGYITPSGDMDFSVVIRSILYNAETQYASFSVGSAITYEADPEQEYAECLLKARAMQAVLEGEVDPLTP